jgi:cytochrome c-type biogenesis protein CcmF
LVELAGRIRLFAVPLTQSLRRLGALPRSSLGMTLAHGGLAIAILGMTGSSVWQQERILTMAPGESISLAGYVFRFDGVTQVAGPNYTARRASFDVRRGDRPVAVLRPETRSYPVERQSTTEAAIRTTFAGDLYAVIGEPQGTAGAHVVRLYFNPLVAWIWAGCAIMVAGGLLSLSDRRHRVGAPARRRAAAGNGVPGERMPAGV